MKIWLNGAAVDAPPTAPGDELLVVNSLGEVLVIQPDDAAAACAAVDAADAAFTELEDCSDDQITGFFRGFARRLADDDVWDRIEDANAADVEDALSKGRSTTRLEVSPGMRRAMISGLEGWAAASGRRGEVIETRETATWRVDRVRVALGVVGFVFEGRPNVVADGCGVLRSGNSAVMRIGSDALGTAEAMMSGAVLPSLAEAGLPPGAVSLVRSRTHASAWSLFTDRRIRLAVARGSGRAVALLGAIAEQSGIPASLHGTGGAWMILDPAASPDLISAAVRSSLDRKVCNTLNTLVLTDPAVQGQVLADTLTEVGARVHFTPAAAGIAQPGTIEVGRADGVVEEERYTPIDVSSLGTEWEWEDTPEVTIHVEDSVDDAIVTFNRYSPCFVVSLIGGSETTFIRFRNRVNAPYVGNGFTRWVDGQWAWDRPELGLTNWERGRLLGRSGILAGDDVYSVKDIFTDLTGRAEQHR